MEESFATVQGIYLKGCVKRHKSLTLTAHVCAHKACSCYSQSLLPAHTHTHTLTLSHTPTPTPTHTHTHNHSHIFSLGGWRRPGNQSWRAKAMRYQEFTSKMVNKGGSCCISVCISQYLYSNSASKQDVSITIIKYIYPFIAEWLWYTYSIWNCKSGMGWSLNIVHALPLWVIWPCKEVGTPFNSPGQGCPQWEVISRWKNLNICLQRKTMCGSHSQHEWHWYVSAVMVTPGHLHTRTCTLYSYHPFPTKVVQFPVWINYIYMHKWFKWYISMTKALQIPMAVLLYVPITVEG